MDAVTQVPAPVNEPVLDYAPGSPERAAAAAHAYDTMRSLDDTRLVVDNSGWAHVKTDLVDWHYYDEDPAAWAANVEALATGTPVVARPLGSMPEVLRPGSTGHLVDGPDDAADMMRKGRSRAGGQTVALDAIKSASPPSRYAGMAAFDAALLHQLRAPEGAPASFFAELAERYRGAAALFTDPAQKKSALERAGNADEIAKAIGGTANAHTAAICTLTKNQPAKVCTSAAVKALQGELGAG